MGVETIEAVIEAFGKGEIKLEAVDPKQHRAGIRFHAEHDRPYTLMIVARYLGWTKANGTQATYTCRATFDAYHQSAAAMNRKVTATQIAIQNTNVQG